MKLTRLCLSMVACSMLGGTAAMAAAPVSAPASAPASAAAPAAGGKMSFYACHRAFNAAKRAGTLNGQQYVDFKQSHCNGPDAAAQSSSSAPAEAGKSSSAASAAPAASGDAVFPARISPEFASLTPGKARMQTCLAQYNANKSTGGNGGLRWIQKGGGYYSECNTRLKEMAR